MKRFSVCVYLVDIQFSYLIYIFPFGRSDKVIILAFSKRNY